MPRKKIAILVNSLSSGGAERIVSHLLYALSDDFDVHLLLLRDEIDYPIPADQKIALLSRERMGGSEGSSNLVRLPIVAWRLRKYCEVNGIDLVLSFMTRPNFAAGLARKLGSKAKVVMNERTYTPLFYDNATLRGTIGKLLVSWLYPSADVIVPNSEGAKDALIDIFKVDKNPYFVVKNQISVSEIVENSHEQVKDIQFNRFTFVCVAGFRKEKNHALLIESFAKVRELDAQLLLIGKGPTLQRAREKAAQLGIAEKVIFAGQKQNPHSYVNRSHCVVLSSNFEGFPNVLLEAMACGKPIISTDCPTGARELLAPSLNSPLPAKCVYHGEYGILVPVNDVEALADAMAEIARDPSVREHYSKAGAARINEFDRDTNQNPFKSIISDLLEGNSL